MAKMIDINLRPDEKTLRHFGWIAVFGFGFLALLAWNQWLIFAFVGEGRVGLTGAFSLLAGAAGLFSLVYPKANLPIYLGLTVAAYPIGFVLSYVILGTIFYLMLAPVGLFFRLTGRDLLNRRFEAGRESYWCDARPGRPDESYFRQF